MPTALALVRSQPIVPRCCSACGREEHDARVLLAGVSFLVCDECVDLLATIVLGKLGDKALPETKALLAGEAA